MILPFSKQPLFYQPLPFYGKSLTALDNCKTIPSYRNWPYLTKAKCPTLLAPYLAEGSETPILWRPPYVTHPPIFRFCPPQTPHLLLTLPLTMSFMQQGVKYWSLVDMTWLFANTLIRYHTQTHKVVSRMTYPYRYILTPPAMYSQHLSVLHWMNNFLISKLHFTEFYNVFAFQKLLTCRCCISLDYIQ